MFPYRIGTQQPAVYVLMGPGGQPTEATVTTSSSQLAASLSPAARTNQHALASLQAASATSPVAALARQQQLAASLEASLRPLSARITGRTMSAYPSSGGGGGGGGTRLSGGGGTVQLLSVPSFTAAPPVAFPPPGATVQMIQRVPPRTPLAVASSSSLLTGAGGGTTAATMVTHPQAHLFDPNIRFLPPTGVVPLAPQNAPTYQLVPAGHQVLPARKRSGKEQAMDQEVDEAQLLREPIVLSGQPYAYAVKIGKDVVSGKGGRAQQYNKHFRKLITDAFPRYNATQSKIEKREIGIRIYLSIVKAGGRFLDAQGNPMNRSKAILKTMKALKDAKTWANDVKRLACQKRKLLRQQQALKDGSEEDDGLHEPVVSAELMADHEGLEHEMDDDDDEEEEEEEEEEEVDSVSESDEERLDVHGNAPPKVLPTSPTAHDKDVDKAEKDPASPQVKPIQAAGEDA